MWSDSDLPPGDKEEIKRRFIGEDLMLKQPYFLLDSSVKYCSMVWVHHMGSLKWISSTLLL